MAALLKCRVASIIKFKNTTSFDADTAAIFIIDFPLMPLPYYAKKAVDGLDGHATAARAMGMPRPLMTMLFDNATDYTRASFSADAHIASLIYRCWLLLLCQDKARKTRRLRHTACCARQRRSQAFAVISP